MNETIEKTPTCRFRIVQDWGYFWIERKVKDQAAWERAPFSFKSESLAKEHLHSEVCVPYVCAVADGYYDVDEYGIVKRVAD